MRLHWPHIIPHKTMRGLLEMLGEGNSHLVVEIGSRSCHMGIMLSDHLK